VAAKSDIGLSKYMRENGYTSDENLPPTAQEIAEFKEYTMPDILGFAETFNESGNPMAAFEDAFSEQMDEISVFEVVKSDLNFLDLLFLFFGVSTAFGMVRD